MSIHPSCTYIYASLKCFLLLCDILKKELEAITEPLQNNEYFPSFHSFLHAPWGSFLPTQFTLTQHSLSFHSKPSVSLLTFSTYTVHQFAMKSRKWDWSKDFLGDQSAQITRNSLPPENSSYCVPYCLLHETFKCHGVHSHWRMHQINSFPAASFFQWIFPSDAVKWTDCSVIYSLGAIGAVSTWSAEEVRLFTSLHFSTYCSSYSFLADSHFRWWFGRCLSHVEPVICNQKFSLLIPVQH